MIRRRFIFATFAVVLSAVMLPSSRADEFAGPSADQLEAPPFSVPAPLDYDSTPARPVLSSGPVNPRVAVLRQVPDPVVVSPSPMAIDAAANVMAPQAVPQQAGYVRLGAPMYPSPRPNIPIWTGGSMITTPAFAPHEMLYPHTYRAIYPPFYHRVKGGWIWTPLGMRTHERWELQGTQVQVKYRSQPPIWTSGMWFPPATSGRHHHFGH